MTVLDIFKNIHEEAIEGAEVQCHGYEEANMSGQSIILDWDLQVSDLMAQDIKALSFNCKTPLTEVENDSKPVEERPTKNVFDMMMSKQRKRSLPVPKSHR